MYNIFRITLLLLAANLSIACATSPSQESDFAIHGEVPEGPGVFSGDEGKFVYFANSSDSTSSDGGEVQPGVELTASDWEEFGAFKRWLKARQSQDESYQEFLQWRQYEAYKNWQDTQ